MDNKSNGNVKGNKGEGRPVSRRTAIAAIGTGTLAAAGAAMLLPKGIALGQTVAGAVYGDGESCCGAVNVTIAQLRTDTAPAAPGGIYYVTDAGREGEFYYDAGDALSSDDNGTVFVSGTGKRYKRTSGRFPANVFNVRWFGAKGDNATDDSAAFQSAINKAQEQYEVDKTGGTVYVRYSAGSQCDKLDA